MKRLLIIIFSLIILSGLGVYFLFFSGPKNKDPLKTELVTTDLDNFWRAFDASQPDFDPKIFEEEYLNKGSKGLKGFIKNRIQNAEHLSKVIKAHPQFYASIRKDMVKIPSLKEPIQESMVKLKEIYPDAVFPPVYFVIGALNSGGTTSQNGLIIGAEMHGLTPETPMEELNDWLQTVLKPVDQIPHIVAHEVIHYQQSYFARNLLAASIKEGSADFLAELISGDHINQHVHEFGDQREEELWKEFKAKMFESDYQGWLYSSQEGRPNDLGYWMGYKIVKSYYDNSEDKMQAIDDIMNIKSFKKFLEESRYPDKFEKS